MVDDNSTTEALASARILAKVLTKKIKFCLVHPVRDAIILQLYAIRRVKSFLYVLAACRREQAMAHYKALRLVRSRPFAQKNHMSVSENVRVREAFLPVWYLSTIAYAWPVPHSSKQ